MIHWKKLWTLQKIMVVKRFWKNLLNWDKKNDDVSIAIGKNQQTAIMNPSFLGGRFFYVGVTRHRSTVKRRNVVINVAHSMLIRTWAWLDNVMSGSWCRSCKKIPLSKPEDWIVYFFSQQKCFNRSRF